MSRAERDRRSMEPDVRDAKRQRRPGLLRRLIVRPAPGRRRPALRRGSITVFVLVCLVAIMSICGVILRIGLAERQRVRGEEQRLQAEWLVESGLERAAARIEASRGDYQGETWDLSASDLGGPSSGRVTIAVEMPKGTPGRRRARVQAEYPRYATTPTRLTKELTVTIESASKGESP